MTKKSVTTGRDGRTIAQLTEEQGALTTLVGSFIEIRTESGKIAHVKNSDRTLTKQERERIFKLLLAIGFTILVGAACWLWYVPQLAMGM